MSASQFVAFLLYSAQFKNVYTFLSKCIYVFI
jgi:hypothetical protein